jgi:uncharacterized small protein (DUF1192 family)
MNTSTAMGIAMAKDFDGIVEAIKGQRDELRAEVARAEAKCAAEYEAHRMTQCERDALTSEVERLKAERENWRVSSVCRELSTEVERLKADNARLEYIIIGTGITREIIDRQMKGDA